MLARAEIRIDPLPVQPLVRSLERRGPNNLLEGGSIRHLAANAHAFFEGDRESHIYRVETGLMRLYRLLADGRAFPCACSRADVARAAQAPHEADEDGPRLAVDLDSLGARSSPAVTVMAAPP